MSITAKLEERLLRYVQIDTQADDKSTTRPSTKKQYDLLNLLVTELESLGAEDVVLTPYANVLATIPATDTKAPSIGFLAHVDTALEVTGANVKPIVHRAYDGSKIVLPDDSSQVIDPEKYPYLAQKTGDDLITSSGTTLLGADDKSGVAVVMTLAEILLTETNHKHGKVRVCFTCDEEIGRGVHPDLPKDLDVDFAYTLDGGRAGSIDYQTFSADLATFTIEGVSLHPGASYGQAVNAMHIAAKLLEALPQDHLTPATTKGDQGFLHACRMEGNQAKVEIEILMRDFELSGLEAQRTILEDIRSQIAAIDPRAKVTLEIRQQYRNMRYWLEKDMRPVELALAAVKAAGMEPITDLTRGGTDGSVLTELGVPTPNIFTGQQNLHGPLEWISVQDMEKSTHTCLHLLRLAAV